MGISGLLSLLKSIQRPCNLQKFNGLTIGVDAYVWLHRGTVASAIDLALDKPTSKFVDFAMNRVRMLIHFGITPYLVFDGDYLPSKGLTEDGRAKRREESKAFGLQLYRAGKVSQAQAELQKAVDVTPEMAGQLMEELRKHNVKFVVAPYEADAQLAYMEREGIIQGIISEDSDLLVFGARRLLTKLDQYGDCIEINRDHFTACKSVSLVGWTDHEFRRMAILSGCDYLSNVNGLGLKTAYGLVRKFHTTERIIQRLRFDAKYSVPADYLESFRKAELTFLHQWVFCPTEKKLKMGTPLERCEFEDLDFLGKDLDPTIARGVASGRLHPTTKQPLVSQSAPLRNSQSPWNAARSSQLATPSEKIGKPIEQYFKKQRVPLAELDPNTFTPSPSQLQLQQNANRSWLSSPATASPLAPTLSRAPLNVSSSGRASTALSRSNSIPSKRPRLCTEEDVAGSKEPAATRSRFFSSQPPRPSPLLSRASKRKEKSASINIWSDDSIDDALEELSQIGTPSTDRIPVYRDTGVDESNRDTALTSAPHLVSKQSSSMTESSFADSVSTQATSVSLLEPNQSYNENEDDKPLIHAKKDVPSLDDKVKLCRTANPDSRIEAPDVRLAEFIPDSPLQSRESEARLVGEASTPVPASPVPQRVPVCGSEDLLVPASDEEPESDEETGTGVAPLPRLNLGRFMFAG